MPLTHDMNMTINPKRDHVCARVCVCVCVCVWCDHFEQGAGFVFVAMSVLDLEKALEAN